MADILFAIGATDLTKYEDKEKHNVNQEKMYSSWTDGNWVEHREVVRTRISGTVELSFPRATDYATFLSLLSSSITADGYYPVKAWCSNTNTTETFNAFLTIGGDTKWDVTCPIKWQGITVDILER